MNIKCKKIFNGLTITATMAVFVLNFQNCSNSSKFTQSASAVSDAIPDLAQETPKVEESAWIRFYQTLQPSVSIEPGPEWRLKLPMRFE